MSSSVLNQSASSFNGVTGLQVPGTARRAATTLDLFSIRLAGKNVQSYPLDANTSCWKLRVLDSISFDVSSLRQLWHSWITANFGIESHAVREFRAPPSKSHLSGGPR